MSNWMEWAGNATGAPPEGVASITRVDLRLRDNTLVQKRPAGEILWLQFGAPSDVLAFRLSSQLMRFCLHCGALEEAEGAQSRPKCCPRGPGNVVESELGRLAQMGWRVEHGRG